MTFLQEQSWYRLKITADQADKRYTEVIKSRTGRDRWTLTPDQTRIPEIREAYARKVTADANLLTFMRWVGTTADLAEGK